MVKVAKPWQKQQQKTWPQARFGKRETRETPENFIKIGEVAHPVQNTNLLVVKLTEEVVPYFNASIYGEGNKKIADVHEVFGQMNDYAFCSIKLDEKLNTDSYPAGSIIRADKFRCIDFDRVKGASKLATADPEGKKKPSKTGKDGYKKGTSNKYKTVTQFKKSQAYNAERNREIHRDLRDPKKRQEMFKKTVALRGDTIKIHRKIKFTDE
ncbi:H/ACA ribonucleoprotein complex subunit 1 [Nematocida sp. AWRm80]|nr:H/ACA ribonucleoprotein complex subunit 1 [Nematocida sp. AWRm80]